MTYFQVIFLAVVQGLTEFFPVSSSGHLVLFQKLFLIKEPPIFFDVLVHVGTLFAILVFFRKEIRSLLVGLLKNKKEEKKDFFNLLFASIPIFIVGFLVKDYLKEIFSSVKLVGFSLLLTSLFLFLTKFFNQKNKNFNFKSAFLVGLFQALAIIPGISRSGSTISAGLFSGIRQEKAFKFSFLLSIPAIIGALFLQLLELKNNTDLLLLQAILGMIVSFAVGFLSLKFLKRIVVNSQLWIFGFYCFLLGIASLVFF
jgi:undecaprenyl-diphosphatase